jgi:hypothetical protein
MDPEALAAELFPHLRALLLAALREVCVHQYVLVGSPRRRYSEQETWITYEFFCERCLDVKHKTKRINRAGGVKWCDY